MIGTSQPSSERRRTISGTAAADSSLFTVTRTSCDPALARAVTWATVPATSAVSVLVIDWMTIGCLEPIWTDPTVVVTVRRRWAYDITYQGVRLLQKVVTERPLGAVL